MNDEEFEDKLRVLASKLTRPDPTAAWKAEILTRARTEATVHTPRWLVLGLGMSWICIAILRLTTPETTSIHRTRSGADMLAATPADFRHTSDTPLRALIALHSNPQFPDHP